MPPDKQQRLASDIIKDGTEVEYMITMDYKSHCHLAYICPFFSSKNHVTAFLNCIFISNLLGINVHSFC